MRLVLVRHAEAAPFAEGGDIARPLTQAGRNRAAVVGRWLRRQGLATPHIVSSPAVRAQETARQVASAWSPPPAVHIEPRLYEAEVGDVFAVARAHAAVPVLALVGHNPAFGALVGALDEAVETRFAPGSVAVLEGAGPGAWRVAAYDAATGSA